MYSYSYLRAVNLHGMNNDEGRSPLFPVRPVLTMAISPETTTVEGNVPAGLCWFTLKVVDETFYLTCDGYPVEGFPQYFVNEVNAAIAQVSNTRFKCVTAMLAMYMIARHFQDMNPTIQS